MKQEEFLNILKDRLQVLNEKEREDILSEYRQHIELRMESGLTEEEAIRDFGDLNELVEEILDAYSVNPEYGKRSGFDPKAGAKAAGEAVSAGTRRAGAFCRRAASALKRWTAAFFRGAAGLAGRIWSGAGRMFKGIAGFLTGRKRNFPGAGETAGEEAAFLRQEERQLPTAERVPVLSAETASLATAGRISAPPAAGRSRKHWIRSFFRGIRSLAVFCIQVLGTVFVLLPMAAVDFFAAACFGILLVLSLMGYPAVGLTVGALGGAVSCTALIVLTADILFAGRGPKEKKRGVQTDRTGEEESGHEA